MQVQVRAEGPMQIAYLECIVRKRLGWVMLPHGPVADFFQGALHGSPLVGGSGF